MLVEIEDEYKWNLIPARAQDMAVCLFVVIHVPVRGPRLPQLSEQ